MEVCNQHENLEEKLDVIHTDIKEIRNIVIENRINVSTLDVRVSRLEHLVYGSLGVAVAALFTCIVTILVK